MLGIAIGFILALTHPSHAFAEGSAEQGKLALFNTPFAVGPGLGTIAEEEWDNLWLVFPESVRNEIEADPSKKQKLTLERYGLFVSPSVDPKRPVAFVPNLAKRGKWEMTCFACHGGRIPSPNGPVFYPGAPATTFDVMTFIEDRIALMHEHKSASRLSWDEKLVIKSYEKVLAQYPVDKSGGTYNVWTTGDALMSLRTRRMRTNYWAYVKALLGHPPTFGNQVADLDPPAWWNTKYRDRLWMDGFTPKESRFLGLIVMGKGNDLIGWDQDGVFDDLLAFINSVEAPKNSFPIEQVSAARGKIAFDRSCAKCHGTYDSNGPGVDYPNRIIPIDRVGTDSDRLKVGMTVEYRRFVRDSWVGKYGDSDVTINPEGYQPPPLRGIWASAPYFHNGSVPTLYHVLFPDERPAIWKANSEAYNEKQVGLSYVEKTAKDLLGLAEFEQRTYFDTTLPGKSNDGHLFPDQLTREERLDVLEYLKTL